MLSRLLTRSAFSTVVVLSIVATAVGARPPIPRASGVRRAAGTAIRSATSRRLPASIATVELAAGRRLTAIVAADIDADGDLDVVASDSALQLHVWVNDGAGHFTRRDPIQASFWHPVPAAPAVDGRRLTIESFTPSSPPSFDAGWRLIAWSLDESASPLTSAPTPSFGLASSTRVPRAPPLPI